MTTPADIKIGGNTWTKVTSACYLTGPVGYELCYGGKVETAVFVDSDGLNIYEPFADAYAIAPSQVVMAAIQAYDELRKDKNS